MQRSHCLRCLFIVVFSFCLLSCSWSETRRLLSTSERIMTERPDSALNILLDVNSDDLHTRKQRAKHALLLSMALDKNYIDIADDSIISIAYNYFQHHPTKREKMLSSYYSGIVKQNAGNHISAVIDFEQAEKYAIETGDLFYQGLSSWRKGDLFTATNNNTQSIEYYKLAVNCFSEVDAPRYYQYAKLALAQCLANAKLFNEADSVIQSFLVPQCDNHLSGKLQLLQAQIMLEQNAPATEILKLYEDVSLDTYEMLDYSLHGLAYERNGQRDSADNWITMAYKQAIDWADSATIDVQSSLIAYSRKEYEKAYHLLDNVIQAQDSITRILLQQSVTGALEQWYRESYNNQKERTMLNNIIYSVLGVLLLMIILALGLLARKLHLDRVQDMADIDSLSNDLQALREKNANFRKTADSVIIDKVQFLQQLSESYFSWTDEEVKKREKRYGIQTKDELISVFRQQLGEIRSEKRLIISLEEAVNSSNDNLIQRLRTEYRNKLKEEDFSTLTLLYSGLSVKSIAFYLRITEPALRTRKTRYKHLFEENPTPSSEEFIQRLSNGDSSLRSE